MLADATAACAELGIGGLQGEDMVVVEDTDTVHNVIVCTLCSCYPWPVLGLPPNWYKYPAYRSRIVREPRAVLRDDFGYDVPDSVEIRVWDSSAELRYWVLPQRPAGTDGDDGGGAGGARDPRLDDRRRSPGRARSHARMRSDTTEIGDARRRVEQLLVELPGDRDQLSFEQPWELRAFAMAVAAHHNGYYDWSEFQLALIGAIRRWEGDDEHRRRGATTSAGWRRWRRCSPGPACSPAPSSTIAAHTIITTPRDANHHHARREPVMVDPAH